MLTRHSTVGNSRHTEMLGSCVQASSLLLPNASMDKGGGGIFYGMYMYM